jgi:hypothetical protein
MTTGRKTKAIRAAERADTAEAWYWAWLSQAHGSEGKARCTAEAIRAAERAGTAEAWYWAWLCLPQCAAEAIRAAERAGAREAWRWAWLCQAHGSEGKAQCKAQMKKSARGG